MRRRNEAQALREMKQITRQPAGWRFIGYRAWSNFRPKMFLIRSDYGSKVPDGRTMTSELVDTAFNEYRSVMRHLVREPRVITCRVPPIAPAGLLLKPWRQSRCRTRSVPYAKRALIAGAAGNARIERATPESSSAIRNSNRYHKDSHQKSGSPERGPRDEFGKGWSG